MRKTLLTFLLIVCVFSFGSSRSHGKLVSLLPTSLIPKGRTDGSNKTNGIPGLGGMTGIPSSVTAGISSGLDGLGSGLDGLGGGLNQLNPVALMKFLTTQISYFKDKVLYIYDDQERPFRLKLELPDFNWLNLNPDFNEKVTFSLYNKKGGNESFDILKINNNTALRNSRFDTNKPTVFITHGFLASSNGTSVVLVRDAYLKKYDYNIIAVDWSPLSVGSYVIARLMVPGVGKHVGKMIDYLYKNGMNPNKTTLVGHSLGSHVMGFAGQTASEKINHTIGLDPAWPLFVGLPSVHRLSDDDAQHVEIIHTNGGFLGTPVTTGRYDFYPNGGFFQNGCLKEIFTACSHGRSYKYLSEQIKEEGESYDAVRCDTYGKFQDGSCSNNDVAIMGGVNRFGARPGNYYLNTKDSEPFGLGFSFKNLTGL